MDTYQINISEEKETQTCSRQIEYFNHHIPASHVVPSSSINPNKKPFHSIMQPLYWHPLGLHRLSIFSSMDFLNRHFNWQIVFLIWITSTVFNISILQLYNYFSRNWIKTKKITSSSNIQNALEIAANQMKCSRLPEFQIQIPRKLF